MCAGTVVAPPGATSAAIFSVTSRSRSVALNERLARSALISTLAKMGIVLRRSTTRWTWPSDFNRAARSTVTFMPHPARKLAQGNESDVSGHFSQGFKRLIPYHCGGPPALSAGRNAALDARVRRPAQHRPAGAKLFLQLPLQQFNFLGQGVVIVH